ncbi:MAG: DsrE family protein [Alkalimonas sp.]|nr:DsrE family protein [Alkalimonas sp.]
MAASILVWLDSSPFNNQQAREALDYTLALAAVDHQVQLLLTGPAVMLLLPHQDVATQLQLKDMSKAIGLFELYEVPPPMVTDQALQHYRLEAQQLAYTADIIAEKQLTALVSGYQHIVRF